MRSRIAIGLLLVAAVAPATAHAEPTAELTLAAPHLSLSGPMHSFAGNQVAGVGDFNGDGSRDVAVAGNSVAWIVPGPTGTGDAALDATGPRIDASAIWDFTSIKVAGAGDVNGDGLGDLVIGIRSDDQNARPESGSAYVIFGSASSAPITLPDLGDRGFRVDGAARGDGVGTSVDGAGDVNGDGLSDVVIGTEGNGNSREGRSAYVVFGKRSTDTVLLNAADLANKGVRINGDRPDLPGAAVAGAGDVNRDGYADVLVGAPWADANGRLNSGSVYLIFGRKGHATVWLDDIAARGMRIDGAAAGDRLGAAVSRAGDVDGDGRSDLLLGAPDTDLGGGPGDGDAYVVFFRGAATPSDLAALGSGGLAIHTLNFPDDLARSVAAAGDVDGDGHADLLVGAPETGFGNAFPGAAYLVLGRAAGGSLDARELGQAGRVIRGPGPDDRLGTSVAGLGDVTGDGRPDIAVGAPRYDDATAPNVGLAQVFGL